MMKHRFYVLNYVERRMLALQGIVGELHRDLLKSKEDMQRSRQSESGESQARNETGEIRFNSTEDGNKEQSVHNGGGANGDQNKPDEPESDCNEEYHDELYIHRERRGERNESTGRDPTNDEEPTSENKLLLLLDIEEGLMLLHHKDYYTELWGKLIAFMRHKMNTIIRERPLVYYVERFDEHEDYILRMMWESNDSVWLLKTDQWGARFWSILQKFQGFMKRVYSADIGSDQYPKTRPDREQLLSTFQERLHQWKIRFDFLQHQYLFLHDMLESWPQPHQVRTHNSKSANNNKSAWD